MKRLLFYAGFALSLSAFASCGQNDNKSPDSSGATSAGRPLPGADTTNTGGSNNGSLTNPGSNNNGQINTADSSMKKQ